MTDITIHLIARLVPQAGKEVALAETILALVPQVLSEAGCLAYAAHESLDAPGVIVIVEAWADQAALDTHAALLTSSGAAARISALLAQPLSLERLRAL
ncbi:putative quinol monooxygenase [Novosphingobium sp. KACC 22771]|uniref:putative quinol monooxygenase n=1 Tax=Novosphingobium sp. KACC 22771 TaxID=3025670 RepID=UPI0023669E97|nr:putative quinol monooxygenase [Novosphingobium sp. KACC 22771]WDF75258.1 putative quinol monooxygenase [Novosphingobium sp. KACC 22771]